MKIVNVDNKISRAELSKMADKMFGNLVKAVVDVERKVIAIDAPMHADQEAELLKNGSRQNDLWGINLHPGKEGKDFIEFDSMINIRPSQDNRSRGVDDRKVKQKIIDVVNKLVEK